MWMRTQDGTLYQPSVSEGYLFTCGDCAWLNVRGKARTYNRKFCSKRKAYIPESQDICVQVLIKNCASCKHFQVSSTITWGSILVDKGVCHNWAWGTEEVSGYGPDYLCHTWELKTE